MTTEEVLIAFGITFILLNPITDYCSLIETRLILKWMDSGKHFATIIILTILDGVLTFAICISLFTILLTWFATLTPDSTASYLNVVEGVWNGFLVRDIDAVFAVYIYTTFATSVWIWFYVLAETAFRLFPYFQKWFPIEGRPFQAVGGVVCMLAGFSYFMVGGISIIASTF